MGVGSLARLFREKARNTLNRVGHPWCGTTFCLTSEEFTHPAECTAGVCFIGTFLFPRGKAHFNQESAAVLVLAKSSCPKAAQTTTVLKRVVQMVDAVRVAVARHVGYVRALDTVFLRILVEQRQNAYSFRRRHGRVEEVKSRVYRPASVRPQRQGVLGQEALQINTFCLGCREDIVPRWVNEQVGEQTSQGCRKPPTSYGLFKAKGVDGLWLKRRAVDPGSWHLRLQA
mmetsp:Transcript_2557/g.6129  ORF Transcript_2557/g.6129 Transcript_2557/m.6129 type:complete len:229 (-) Transcript_2557:654-1340(-)